MAAINLRCADGVNLETLNIQHVNGKDFEASQNVRPPPHSRECP